MSVDGEHIPVLADEVLEALAPLADGLYIDATFGRGGHTARILGALGPAGRVLAFDRDPSAIEAGHRRFPDEVRLALVRAPFADIAARVPDLAAGRPVRGILFDLGVSSPQLDDATRGFSFRTDGPLDMRMDPQTGEPVSAWLARASESEIRTVIASLGEERFARRIAAAVVRTRAKQPLTSTRQLAELVSTVVRTREPGKHPATRTFQALRMLINDELGQLQQGLAGALELLAPGARLAVISFHSLEDRPVKQFMQKHAAADPMYAGLPNIPERYQPRLKLIGKKRRPTEAEMQRNPRARSATLRVAEKVR
ncbi:MAG TPA: 16S rRNA (cytosine(1402)-N(4))-methyltransferase RsmH [Steroidobacteraceae bacterium]|nr:16S rRNA (cytosine(1402)-N(4))-methyltransferase RsmH [Steroidobacteraceae bacterium]HRX89382.1 16S rRNA (cytosine(1402)-N(4))-methyltransferase RsmH [Steroidobacteraceae bacterium]